MALSLTLRNVKGSELTWDELDTNFLVLKNEIEALKGAGSTIEPYLAPITKANTSEFEYGRLVLREYLAFSQSDLDSAKEVVTSLSSIYSTWYRFSHGSSGTFPAIASELTSWSYNASTNTLASTTNSSSYIGFVSSERYETYRHEVVLNSTNADDDTIGVILAFYKDPTDGSEHTLSFIRSAGGMAPACGIVYNFGQSSSWVITKDDTVTTFTNPGGTGWSSRGARVLCVRNGNDFAVATTEIGAPTGAVSHSLAVNLSSDPRLAKFMGESPFGYSAFSQSGSSFSSIKFTPVIGSIYDILNNKVWDLDIGSGTFVNNNDKKISDLSRGRLIYAPNLKKLYYISPSGSFDNISSNDSSTNTVVKKGITINAGAYYEISPSAEFIGGVSDVAAVTTTVRVKDTTVGSTTIDMMINAEAVSTVAYTASTIRIYNEYSTALTFDIILKR